MKVSKKDVVEKWDSIKGHLNKPTHDTYALFQPGDFANPPEGYEEVIAQFISDVNDQIKDIKDGGEKASLKHKYAKGQGGKVTDKRKKGEAKASKETKTETKAAETVEVKPAPSTEGEVLKETKAKGSADITIAPYGKGLIVYGGTKAIKDELKAIGGEWSPLKRKDKPANVKWAWIFKAVQKAEIERVISGAVKKDEVKTVKIGGKKYKVAKRGSVRLTVSQRKTVVKSLKPKAETKKAETKKAETETKAKTPRQTKPKVAEAPNWLRSIRSFVNAAGKEKPVVSIRKIVQDIQDRFHAKRGLKTPHIELIREIQKYLLPFANSDKKKVTIPAYADFVARCKAAINTLSVSTKIKKDNLSEQSLAGLGKVWRIDYLTFNAKAFKTLAEAKAFVKSLDIDTVKKMTRKHSFIYCDCGDGISKVCNFNVSGGKVAFKAVENY